MKTSENTKGVEMTEFSWNSSTNYQDYNGRYTHTGTPFAVKVNDKWVSCYEKIWPDGQSTILNLDSETALELRAGLDNSAKKGLIVSFLSR